MDAVACTLQSNNHSDNTPAPLHHCSYIDRTHHPTIDMSRKSVAAAAPLPEVLLLGCEGVGKSCLTRQIKRCAHTDCDEDVNLAAAPTVAHMELTVQRCTMQQLTDAQSLHSLTTRLLLRWLALRSMQNGVERDELRFQQTSFIVKEIGEKRINGACLRGSCVWSENRS
jgi:hypothetical protein